MESEGFASTPHSVTCRPGPAPTSPGAGGPRSDCLLGVKIRDTTWNLQPLSLRPGELDIKSGTRVQGEAPSFPSAPPHLPGPLFPISLAGI